jgi:hypothetical protein
MAWVVVCGALSDRRRQPRFVRLGGATSEEFRQQAVSAIGSDGSARQAPRRLPDESRQPIA